MESQPKDQMPVTEGKELYMQNLRTLQFLFLAAIIGLGGPIAALIGADHGEKDATRVNPQAQTVKSVVDDFKAMVIGSPGDAEKGNTIFQANCVACHGPTADGQGPAAVALKPAPRNFLDPTAKWTFGRNLPDIYTTISNGSPGTAMVGFSASLSIADRWAVVHYLASLPGVKGQFLPLDEAIASAWRPGKKP